MKFFIIGIIIVGCNSPTDVLTSSTVSPSGGFFMPDSTLENQRFGITLDLFPSCYQFFPNDSNQLPISTICHNFVTYIQEQGAILTLISGNSYLVENIYTTAELKILLEFYWASVGNICPD